MTETRFFADGTIPEYTTAPWYHGIERAPHLEQDGHRGRLLLATEFIEQAIAEYGVITVSDMGCGDGGLLSLIRNKCDCWGYDLQTANVDAAITERFVDAKLANVLTDPVKWGDLTVCTEMLEHLVDPHTFVSKIQSRIVVASSPDGETEQSHYEFHTWGWNMEGYRAMFENAGWNVVRHETIGFQVVLAVRS